MGITSNQITRHIKKRIMTGDLTPGERIPSIRKLSNQLKANPNTIQRSLRNLEEEKLVLTINRKKIVQIEKSIIEKVRIETFEKETRQLLAVLKNLEVDYDDFIHILKENY